MLNKIIDFPVGAAPVTEKASPMNQLVEKTAALATMQRAVTDVSKSCFYGSCIYLCVFKCIIVSLGLFPFSCK